MFSFDNPSNLSVSDPRLLSGEGLCIIQHLSKGFKGEKKDAFYVLKGQSRTLFKAILGTSLNSMEYA